MVQFLLGRAVTKKTSLVVGVLCVVFVALIPAWASRQPKKNPTLVTVPDLLLDGGRKLTYERSFGSEREVKPKRGFWNRVLDVIAGEPEFHLLVRPYSVATDSHGRIIVTDPGAVGVHHHLFHFQHDLFDRLKIKSRAGDVLCLHVLIR